MEETLHVVIFRLDSSPYAIDALEVKEMLGGSQWKPLTVEGEEEAFLQVRGQVARVVDLGKMVGLSPKALDSPGSFILVKVPDYPQKLAALQVDQLVELAQFHRGKIKTLPQFFRSIPPQYLMGFIEWREEPVCILDLPKILKEALEGKWEMAMEASGG